MPIEICIQDPLFIIRHKPCPSVDRVYFGFLYLKNWEKLFWNRLCFKLVLDIMMVFNPAFLHAFLQTITQYFCGKIHIQFPVVVDWQKNFALHFDMRRNWIRALNLLPYLLSTPLVIHPRLIRGQSIILTFNFRLCPKHFTPTSLFAHLTRFHPSLGIGLHLINERYFFMNKGFPITNPWKRWRYFN